ncbi:DUF6265 family protein [Pseudoalteromonas luteoviolacea]|uniref:DUF6265 family protein n=1 Tax=Pseudoalteromonas luteoviolacea TaxID=43657 RepID=UPI001F20DB2D|nr:DUF6265 family protein [Pseudoalteromonas luteoviolacea]MCF6443041.1 DUF6265 family protein [Pseudoalteromonas luteoviolacea]
MSKFAYLIIIFFAFHTLAEENTCDSLESLSWLIGGWSSKSSKLQVKESWKKVSNSTFEGSGYTYSIKKSKTVSVETLRLVEMSGEVFYVAKVASNSLPIAFKLTSCTAETAIFENPDHDFPKKLTYQFKSENNITVAVTGEKGKGFSIKFMREIDK